jgi:5-methylcytosine-specific restriction endonuclease McrA
MPRSIPEWIGRTDDSAIPEKVQLRVFEANERRCFLCGNLIRPGDGMDIHHKTPLIDGGRHAESNLVPVHRKCHRIQTAREAQERAEHRGTVKSHYGIRTSKRKLQGPGFRKAPPQLKASTPLKKRVTILEPTT